MASLIKSISLKNFKGFSDEVRIDIRPITLLFGANSAGKSTILQALQYVREILERNNADPGTTAQGGSAIDLGGFCNLVHGRDLERQIEIEVGMALGDIMLPELVPNAFEDWQTDDEHVWRFYQALQAIRSRVEQVSVRLTVAWSNRRNDAVVVGYQISTNGDWCAEFQSNQEGRDVSMRLNRDNPIFMVPNENEEVDFLDLISGWVDPADLENITVDGVLQPRMPDMVSILPELFYAVSDTGLEQPGDGLRAWLSGFKGALPNLGEMLHIPAPGVHGETNIYIAREFTAFLSWLTIGPAMLLRDQLQATRYVGPLRCIPPRGFEASLTKSEAAWSNGMAAWETLLTRPQEMVDRCSHWLQDADRLNSGYGLVRTAVQEIDYNTGAPIGRVKPRIALIDQAGLTHQALDVGVGISQVLPIVVAAQDDRASIVSIEQPELHIHPAVQVGLGDLFIDGANNLGINFLIETHSEHLILRLLRRIRETASGELDPNLTRLAPEHVGVNFLIKENGATQVVSIAIDETGEFTTRWPRGFFDERESEFFGAAPADIEEQLRRMFPQ